MLDNKTDVMIHEFMDMLDHSYKYKTSNERTKIERKIRDIAESAVKNLNIPAVSKSLKCDCKHSGNCRYEEVILETKELCRHKE